MAHIMKRTATGFREGAIADQSQIQVIDTFILAQVFVRQEWPAVTGNLFYLQIH